MFHEVRPLPLATARGALPKTSSQQDPTHQPGSNAARAQRTTRPVDPAGKASRLQCNQPPLLQHYELSGGFDLKQWPLQNTRKTVYSANLPNHSGCRNGGLTRGPASSGSPPLSLLPASGACQAMASVTRARIVWPSRCSRATTHPLISSARGSRWLAGVGGSWSPPFPPPFPKRYYWQ